LGCNNYLWNNLAYFGDHSNNLRNIYLEKKESSIERRRYGRKVNKLIGLLIVGRKQFNQKKKNEDDGRGRTE